MVQKNTKSVALTAVTAMLVLMMVGFGEAFAEMLDSGEWQLTTLEISENTEKYSNIITNEDQSENIAGDDNATYIVSVLSKLAHLGAFDEVIRFQ